MFLHTMSHNVISDYKPTKNAAIIQKHRILKMYIPDQVHRAGPFISLRALIATNGPGNEVEPQ